MKCNEIADVLLEYYLGELNEKQAREIETHLASDCPVCTSLAREISDGIDGIYATLAEPELTSEVRKAIFERAIGQQGNSSPSVRPKRFALSYVAGVALSAAAGLLVMMKLMPLEQTPSVEMVAGNDEVKLSESVSDGLGEYQPPANSRMSDERFHTTRLVALNRSSDPSGPSARFVWDPLTGEVHFFGARLPDPRSGRRLVLWAWDPLYMTYSHVELTVDASGRCAGVVTSGTTVAPLLIVTEELVDDSLDAPSQRVVLASS